MQMTFYSGGADGSDSIWEQKLKEKNQKIIVYRPYHINKLTNSEFNEIDKQYLEIVNILKRKPLSAERFAGLLVRRDMLQVNNANAVFAIGTINKYNGYVNGGTAYATTRAILLGIDVYLFEQDKKQWFKWISIFSVFFQNLFEFIIDIKRLSFLSFLFYDSNMSFICNIRNI